MDLTNGTRSPNGDGSVFDDPLLRTFGRLLEAEALLTAALAEQMQQAAGMSLSWFEVLLRLAHSPESRLRLTELASQVVLTTGGITRLIDRIEAAGYVTRAPCPTDRRGAFAVLTEAGHAAARDAARVQLSQLREVLVAPLDDDELAVLDRALDKLITAQRTSHPA